MNDALTSSLDAPAVLRINATSRHGHLVSFLADSSTSLSSSSTFTETPSSSNKRRLEGGYWISLEVTTYLAVQDFNTRESLLVPSLKEQLTSCDLSLSLEMRDTEFSPIVAVRQYKQRVFNVSATQPTMAIVGSIRSTVTASLATVSGTQGIPQVSGLATSAALDDKNDFPYFARTVPVDRGDALATCIFLQSLGVRRFSVFYVNDVYGVSYYLDMTGTAALLGLELVPAAYYENDEASFSSALNTIRNTKLRYVVGILGFRTTEDTLLALYQHQILGVPEYTWLFSESLSDIAASEFSYYGRYQPLAMALNGAAVVLTRPPPDKNATLQLQLDSFASDKTRVEQYVRDHAEPSIFPNNFQLQPVASMGALLFYDAVMALGIAACAAEQDVFTGPQLYEHLLGTSFEGASGQLNFVNETGTRVASQVNFRVVNLLESKASQPNNNNVSRTMAYDTVYINITDHTFEVVRPFVFFDGSSVAPAMAPIPREDLNLIPTVEMVLVFIVASVVAFMSIAFGVWTIRNQKLRAVRVSQPIFLVLLCVGTFLLSFSTIFQAFQEPLPNHALHFACNAYPWFVCIGFTTTFAALFSKTWRINRVHQSAQQFRRVTVRARDVIWPFAVLFVANTIVLTTWVTIVPLNWRRVPLSFDADGQITSSYGTCFKFDRLEGILFITLVVLNATALMIANYESFKARNLPSEFNETFYIALTNAILLEASILGAPVIMLLNKQPKALFLVRSILLMTLSLAVLLPIFIPKMLGMDGKAETRFLKLAQDDIA